VARCGERKERDLKQHCTRRDRTLRRASFWRFFFSQATFPFLEYCGGPNDPTGRVGLACLHLDLGGPPTSRRSALVCAPWWTGPLPGSKSTSQSDQTSKSPGLAPACFVINCQEEIQSPSTGRRHVHHGQQLGKCSHIGTDTSRTGPDILGPSRDSALGVQSPSPPGMWSRRQATRNPEIHKGEWRAEYEPAASGCCRSRRLS
jgi:hypothetical protein